MWDETFPYPAGDLVGQGNWTASPLGAQSPVVTINAVVTSIAFSGDALDAVDLAGADLEEVWTIDVYFTLQDCTPNGSQILVMLGDPGGRFVVGDFFDSVGGGNAGDVEAFLFDPDGTVDQHTVAAAIPLNTLSVFRLEYTKTALNLYMNGVLTCTIPRAGLLALTNNDVLLEFAGIPVATPISINRIFFNGLTA